MTVARRGSTVKVIELARTVPQRSRHVQGNPRDSLAHGSRMGIPMGMGTQICQNGNGNGKSTRDNGNGYFFTCAKIPIGRLDALAPSLRFVLDLSNTLFLQLCSSRQRFPLTQRVARSLCGSTEFLVGTTVPVGENDNFCRRNKEERGFIQGGKRTCRKCRNTLKFNPYNHSVYAQKPQRAANISCTTVRKYLLVR